MKITIKDGDFGYEGELPEDLFVAGSDVEFMFRGRVVETSRVVLDCTPSWASQPVHMPGEKFIVVQVYEVEGVRV